MTSRRTIRTRAVQPVGYAALVSLLLTACSHASKVNGPKTSATSSGASAPNSAGPIAQSAASAASAASSNPVVALAAGKTGSREQVPWDQVGPGWFLVIDDSSVAPGISEGASAASRPGTSTLFLVAPTGGRYVLASWRGIGAANSDEFSQSSLVAWSPSGKKALLISRGLLLVELDLVTGTHHVIKFDHLTGAGYTMPSGENIVAREDIVAGNGDVTGETLTRMDHNGAGRTRLAEVDNSDLQWVYSPDGATLYLNGHGTVRSVSNAGGTIKALSAFTDVNQRCSPTSWWDSTTLAVDCFDTGERMWLVPVNGAKVRPLTPVTGTPPVGMGYSGVVRADGTTFLQHVQGCGTVTLDQLDSSGAPHAYPVPQSVGSDHLVGAVGPRVAVVSSTSCEYASWFGFVDPATNTSTKIIESAPGSVGVGVALPFPRDH